MGYLLAGHDGPGLRQMSRVVGPPPLSLGKSGRHSGQETIFGGFPMVLDSWRGISKNGDRGSNVTQNFAASLVSVVVWPGEALSKKTPSFENCILFENGHVQNFQNFTFFSG